MKIIISSFLVSLTVLSSSNCIAAMSLREGISELSSFIYSELKYQNYLEGRRLAFYGFRDAQTEKGCRALSYYLADQIKSEFNGFRRISRDKFEVIPRDGLERVELEYLFQQGGSASDVNVIKILGPTDIIVSGDWQPDGTHLRLSLKAQKISENMTLEITAKTFTLDGQYLPAGAKKCLQKSQGNLEKDKDYKVETVVWEAASKCGEAACYTAYLKDYPLGIFSRVAKAKLEKIQKVNRSKKIIPPISKLTYNSDDSTITVLRELRSPKTQTISNQLVTENAALNSASNMVINYFNEHIKTAEVNIQSRVDDGSISYIHQGGKRILP